MILSEYVHYENQQLLLWFQFSGWVRFVWAGRNVIFNSLELDFFTSLMIGPVFSFEKVTIWRNHLSREMW